MLPAVKRGGRGSSRSARAGSATPGPRSLSSTTSVSAPTAMLVGQLFGQESWMLPAAVLASSSPLTNEVPSDQNVPDPTSAGIWSEASNAAGLAVLSVFRKACSSGVQLFRSAFLLPVRNPELPPPTSFVCACWRSLAYSGEP